MEYILDGDPDSINPCAAHFILVINGLEEFYARNWTQFRMYAVINMKEGEKPKNVSLNNIVWFQKVKNSRIFSVYEKKRGNFKQTLTWNGKNFFNAKTQKEIHTLKPTVKGEIMRVATTILPPHTYYETNSKRELTVGGAVEVSI